MGRYRKIDSRIWNDEKFRSLTDSGQLVFIYILTHPSMTSLGAMRASIPGLASEKGWAERKFRGALNESLKKGLLKVDEAASFVWAPNFLRYNGPESPNVVVSWEKALDLIPECLMRKEMIRQAACLLKGYQEAFREALPKVFRESMGNQEQEQEQKPEPKPEEDVPVSKLRSGDKDGSEEGNPSDHGCAFGGDWPERFIPLKREFEKLPFLRRHAAFLVDVEFWITEEHRIGLGVEALCAALREAVSYLEADNYQPPGRSDAQRAANIRKKLRNALETAVRKGVGTDPAGGGPNGAGSRGFGARDDRSVRPKLLEKPE